MSFLFRAPFLPLAFFPSILLVPRAVPAPMQLYVAKARVGQREREYSSLLVLLFCLSSQRIGEHLWFCGVFPLVTGQEDTSGSRLAIV